MQRALVTGGTRGLGLAISRRLAQDGYLVTATYAHDEEGAKQAEELAHKDGLSLTVARCDVSSASDWAALFAHKTPLSDDGVDVLCHAAGFTRDKLLLFMPEEDFDAVVDVHLKGGYLATKAALKGMIGKRKGRIVFVTSPTATLGRPGQTAYGAAKAGLAGLMRSLIQEVSRFQITVNCVCAGLTDTALLADLSQAVRQELLAKIPLSRFANAEEVAAAVAWLCSERAAYVTGQTLAVDGGLTR